jgi:hypothetical protein
VLTKNYAKSGLRFGPARPFFIETDMKHPKMSKIKKRHRFLGDALSVVAVSTILFLGWFLMTAPGRKAEQNKKISKELLTSGNFIISTNISDGAISIVPTTFDSGLHAVIEVSNGGSPQIALIANYWTDAHSALGQISGFDIVKCKIGEGEIYELHATPATPSIQNGIKKQTLGWLIEQDQDAKKLLLGVLDSHGPVKVEFMSSVAPGDDYNFEMPAPDIKSIRDVVSIYRGLANADLSMVSQ